MNHFDSLPGNRHRPARFLAATAVLLAASALAPAHAEDKPATPQKNRAISSLALSNDQPIQIESNALTISDKEKIATFTGDVKAVQGPTTLRAGKMIVHYATSSGDISNGNSKIESIDVAGNVFIQSGDQQAKADTGVYNLASQMITLSGKQVVLNKGQNVFVGCRLTVNVATTEAKLDSCGKRVMIQLDPKSRGSASK